jgi:hypothetical protein
MRRRVRDRRRGVRRRERRISRCAFLLFPSFLSLRTNSLSYSIAPAHPRLRIIFVVSSGGHLELPSPQVRQGLARLVRLTLFFRRCRFPPLKSLPPIPILSPLPVDPPRQLDPVHFQDAHRLVGRSVGALEDEN